LKCPLSDLFDSKFIFLGRPDYAGKNTNLAELWCDLAIVVKLPLLLLFRFLNQYAREYFANRRGICPAAHMKRRSAQQSINTVL
jgi:hypothetical protein